MQQKTGIKKPLKQGCERNFILEKKQLEIAVVAFQKKRIGTLSITVVGDWFLAESVSFNQGDGFTNTFFTRDAAEIARRTEDFECELQDLLERKNGHLRIPGKKQFNSLKEEFKKL